MDPMITRHPDSVSTSSRMQTPCCLQTPCHEPYRATFSFGDISRIRFWYSFSISNVPFSWWMESRLQRMKINDNTLLLDFPGKLNVELLIDEIGVGRTTVTVSFRADGIEQIATALEPIGERNGRANTQ